MPSITKMQRSHSGNPSMCSQAPYLVLLHCEEKLCKCKLRMSHCVTCCNIYAERKNIIISSSSQILAGVSCPFTHKLCCLPAPVWASRAHLFPWCLEEESQLVGEGGICCIHGCVADEPSLHTWSCLQEGPHIRQTEPGGLGLTQSCSEG